MLLSAFRRWLQAVPPTRQPRRYRPELLSLEERAVPATVTVHVGPVSNFMVFSPANQTVNAGDTVHWVWDTDNHSVTSGKVGNPDGMFDSGVHNAGFTFDHTFNQAGTFNYFCVIHGPGGMVGTITVQSSTTTPPPTGGTMGGTVPSITIGDVRTFEGQKGAHLVRFRLRLSHASDMPVTVRFSTANGSARAGSDYGAAHGTVTFKAGQTSQVIVIKVNGDQVREKDETFFVKLSRPTMATLGDRQAVGTIRNDDR